MKIEGLLAIRIDGDWTTKGFRLVNELKVKCEKAIFYEHPATPTKGVHIHGLIYGWCKKEDTLRNLLKDITDKSYECKDKIRPRHKDSPIVNEEYIAYMSKGKYDPVYNSGWTDEEVAVQKAKGYDVLDISGGKLVVKKGVKGVDGEHTGRKTRKELIQDIVADLGEGIRRTDERDICEVIRKHLIRNNEVIGMYKVIDLYDSVLMYGSPDQWLDMVSKKIISRVRV